MHPLTKYIIVDIETAGPNPSNYSLLSIGACTIDTPQKTFYCELKPDKQNFEEEAMGIHQLDTAHLVKHGLDPQNAMLLFKEWIEAVGIDAPIFTAFNAPFDWMFINDYFQRYLGINPFGHAALDIKALFMGHKGVDWVKTSHKYMAPKYGLEPALPHHALEDAKLEAQLFKLIMEEIDAEQKGRKTRRTSQDH